MLPRDGDKERRRRSDATGRIDMMNILLINISLRPESRVKLFPIGLAYIATAMKNAGFDFDLIDIDAHRYSDAEVDRLMQKKRYDVVAMGCIVTGYSKVKDLCRRIRKCQRDACIIVGNSVATSIYETLLSQTEANVAVMGEGDITIVELLRALQEGRDLSTVKGICYRTPEGEIIRTAPQPPIKDISSLPFIDFSLFDAEVYIKNAQENLAEDSMEGCESMRSLPVNTARGCIGHCTFCYHNFQGYPYRVRSMDSILEEIRRLIERYRLTHIEFGDELTLFSRKRAEEFADAILESGLNFRWAVTCRADCFTQDSDVEILKKLKNAGCTGIGFSLESSNPEILKAMNKHITTEDFSRTAQLCWAAGITPRTSLVIGYPQETVETIRDTFQCCIDNNIYPSAGYLLPQPGSVMYDYAVEHGYIKDEEKFLMQMGDRQDLRLNMTKIPDEEMEAAVLEGLSQCNDELAVGLDKKHLIKTQFYRKSHAK